MVGGTLLGQLADVKWNVKAALRRQVSGLPDHVDPVVVGDMVSTTAWPALDKIDVVIHTAARVHVMTDLSVDPLAAFRSVNVDGTLNLARQAEAAGVHRFILISSIKVNGEKTAPDHPFTDQDAPSPQDAYAFSKHEAEEGLLKLAGKTGMDVVIIRPPLVYGPGVKANFYKMMHWIAQGIPLPLGAIHNRRSLVALDNLVDLITTCIEHPAAANKIFLAGDGEDMSTTILLQRLGKALGKPARLVPVPQSVLEFGLKMLAKGDMAHRLCGSLQVDISKVEKVLGWIPPVSIDEGLKRTADWYWQQK